jgi:tetratricopeptide (TPR) repeat protein
MDPITKMSQEFMRIWHRFRQSAKVRLFRIDTDPSMHQDLWRLFRAIEMAPDNRSPYLMFNSPFVNRTDFYRAAIEKLMADYALLREGLAKDGVHISELNPPPEPEGEPEEKFALAVLAMWENVKAQFEYLMIIFLPERIEATAEWPGTIEQLLLLFSSSQVRLAVADTPAAMLADLCDRLNKKTLAGRFFISSSALQEYLFKIAAGGWGALSGNQPPKSQGAARQAATASAGTVTNGLAETVGSAAKILPPEEAARLRTCMAKAAVASAERKTEDAVATLREARMICNRNGLTVHEAILLMAIANTFLAGERKDEALAHYEESIVTATRAPAPVVVMQARIGLASTLFHGQSYDRAAEAYEQAARDAVAAESEVMGIEALRMAGTSHNIQGRINDAIRCWNQALGVGGNISLAEINTSTISQVGREFVDLCQRHGLTGQAQSITQQIETIKQQALLREKDHAGVSAAP